MSSLIAAVLVLLRGAAGRLLPLNNRTRAGIGVLDKVQDPSLLDWFGPALEVRGPMC
jgi:hypothetical protein